jgi:hypothetical protein
MNTKTCPNCGDDNYGNVRYCKKCGTRLAQEGESAPESRRIEHQAKAATASLAAINPPAGPLTAVKPPPAYSPSPHAANDYATLRGIAGLCRGLSWIAVALAALQTLGGLLTMAESFFLGLSIVITAVVGGTLLYIFLQVLAESISVLLDIEANTRRAANLLEQRPNKRQL